MRKRLLLGGIFPVALILFVCNRPALPGEKPKAAQTARWVRVSCVGDETVGMKKEIPIDAATAARLFTREFPHLRDGWQKNIPGKLENAADASSIPDGVKKVWIVAKAATAYAKVLGFSKNELMVAVVEHQGTYLYHQYHECKALFRVPRSREIDALFEVSTLEKTYGATHKGLKQGDPVREVTKKLGEPDATIRYQPVDFYKLCYFKENILITVNGNRVASFEFDVPQSLKDEVKKNGGI